MWAQKQVIQQLSLNDLCRFQSSLQDPVVLQIAGKLAHVSRIQTNVKLANVLIIEHIASDDEILRAILYSSAEEIQCLKGGLELRIDQDFKKEAAAKAFIKSKNFTDPIRIQIEEIYKVAASDGVLDMYDAKLRAATSEQEEKEIGNELTKVTEQMVCAAKQFEY